MLTKIPFVYSLREGRNWTQGNLIISFCHDNISLWCGFYHLPIEQNDNDFSILMILFYGVALETLITIQGLENQQSERDEENNFRGLSAKYNEYCSNQWKA